MGLLGLLTFGLIFHFLNHKKTVSKNPTGNLGKPCKQFPLALAQTLNGTGQGQLPYVGDEISLIKSNILYLSGDLDEKYSKIAKEIFAPNPNVTWISVAASGHNIHLENPVTYQKN